MNETKIKKTRIFQFITQTKVCLVVVYSQSSSFSSKLILLPNLAYNWVLRSDSSFLVDNTLFSRVIISFSIVSLARSSSVLASSTLRCVNTSPCWNGTISLLSRMTSSSMASFKLVSSFFFSTKSSWYSWSLVLWIANLFILDWSSYLSAINFVCSN